MTRSSTVATYATSNPPLSFIESKSNVCRYTCIAVGIIGVAAAVGIAAYFLNGKSINVACISGGSTLGIEVLGGAIIIVYCRKKQDADSSTSSSTSNLSVTIPVVTGPEADRYRNACKVLPKLPSDAIKFNTGIYTYYAWRNDVPMIMIMDKDQWERKYKIGFVPKDETGVPKMLPVKEDFLHQLNCLYKHLEENPPLTITVSSPTSDRDSVASSLQAIRYKQVHAALPKESNEAVAFLHNRNSYHAWAEHLQQKSLIVKIVPSDTGKLNQNDAVFLDIRPNPPPKAGYYYIYEINDGTGNLAKNLIGNDKNERCTLLLDSLCRQLEANRAFERISTPKSPSGPRPPSSQASKSSKFFKNSSALEVPSSMVAVKSTSVNNDDKDDKKHPELYLKAYQSLPDKNTLPVSFKFGLSTFVAWRDDEAKEIVIVPSVHWKKRVYDQHFMKICIDEKGNLSSAYRWGELAKPPFDNYKDMIRLLNSLCRQLQASSGWKF